MSVLQEVERKIINQEVLNPEVILPLINGLAKNTQKSPDGLIVIQDYLGVNGQWQHRVDPTLLEVRHCCNANGPYSRVVWSVHGIHRVVYLRQTTLRHPEYDENLPGLYPDLTDFFVCVGDKWIN